MDFPYIDYTYYQEEYRGSSIRQEDFLQYACKASSYLNHITQGRIQKELPEEIQRKIKDACCAAVETLVENANGREIASASNDGYSETYVTSGKTTSQKLYEAVFFYLGDTGLLCCWI